MKQSDWVFALALTIIPLIVGFVAGIILAGDHSVGMPHGLLDYWLERYQTLFVGVLALLGVLVAWVQMKNSDRQHRIGMAMKHLPELNDLYNVLLDLKMVANPIIPELVHKVTFTVLDDGLVSRLKSYPAANRFVANLEKISQEVREFNCVVAHTERKMVLYCELRKDVVKVHEKVFNRVSELCSVLGIRAPVDLKIE